jgi:ubiquitin carboxyl-terminal hydrolase L3
VWGLDDDSLRCVAQPCVGLVFLYPFSQVEAHKRSRRERGRETRGVWFMRQEIGNACGAVALMHVVMNALSTVSKGSGFLAGFGSDTAGASARERAKRFAPAVRDLHEQLAPQGQTAAPDRSADIDFHFVGYTCVDGRLFELDGNNDGPIDLGAVARDRVPGRGFLRAAVAHAKKSYISPFPDSHFSMLALGPRKADERAASK